MFPSQIFMLKNRQKLRKIKIQQHAFCSYSPGFQVFFKFNNRSFCFLFPGQFTKYFTSLELESVSSCFGFDSWYCVETAISSFSSWLKKTKKFVRHGGGGHLELLYGHLRQHFGLLIPRGCSPMDFSLQLTIVL